MISFMDFINKPLIKEAIELNRSRNIPLEECTFRYGSTQFFEYFKELRSLHQDNLLEDYLSEDLIEILESDLGEFALYNSETVPLDFIFEEEHKELNKVHRGGPKKFYVYVRDPSTKNIKKVSFGDTTGLSVKYDNPERKKAFAARHNCSDKTDKTTPGFWSCRVNRYMAKTPAGRRGYW